MADFDVDQMLKMLENENVQMDGLTLDRLRNAVAHPAAAAEIQRLAAREATSVQQGERARDFCIPYLPSSGEGTVRLSDHFGNRPVGLIFGSYT